MKKPFKVLGKRVLLNIPKRPESKIELTPEIERQMEQELIKKWTNLVVHSVGDSVVDVKQGDKVYVSSDALRQAERITIGEDTKLMISEYDIAIVW